MTEPRRDTPTQAVVETPEHKPFDSKSREKKSHVVNVLKKLDMDDSLGELLDRRDEAAKRIKGKSASDADWAIVIAVEAAGSEDMKLDPKEWNDYYAGDSSIDQLKRPVQGGDVAQD